MRRGDFLRTDEAFFQEVAAACSVGILGLVTEEGYPRSVAVDFVADGPIVYFHGALDGEKHRLIARAGIIAKLLERDGPLDRVTIGEMEKLGRN